MSTTTDAVVGAASSTAALQSATQTNKTNDTSGVSSLADEDTFMQLLVAQMQNQDPLNPLDGTQYISQLSQLTATEQTSKMAESMNKMSAIVDNLNTSVLVGQLSSMIGQNVTWTTSSSVKNADGNTTTKTVQHSGIGQGVSITDGVPSLVVKEGEGVTTVPISDLTLIGKTGLENK